ncbi:PAS domain-containing sensor histidine kinase [Pontibacter akesuensis]|uniref:histidine kinase n=1 Tax=Pontibacter akesuensis TaxID=388950 RepID=A0A1I7KL81_9BACT|nr:PAS domain-containing sensor histidine kinase [Pontibacter akesuensis]GHA78004.1 hypothetical protein GCM10007389_34820 [Pontibacter akesuensis]SFU98195.1 two-component system, OmpR family, sensor histidine kinase VicK [Pontibacter akesuensis]
MNPNIAPILEEVAAKFSQVYFVYHPEKGRFQYLNPAFTALFGLPLEDVVDSPGALLDKVHPEDVDFVREHYKLLLAGKVQEHLEFRFMVTAGGYKWICVSAAPASSMNGETGMVAGYAEDITGKKAYLNNVLKFNAKKNSTLEILSHDLAAPFANIQGAINLIEEQLENSDQDITQAIGFIKQDSKRGSDMIRDFVDNEFLESSQVVLHMERIDLAEKIQTVIDSYRERTHLVSKEFRFDPVEKPIFLYLDEMKFMQVVNNLISNSIKFTNDGGIITVALEDKGKTVLVSVADNGIGIPEDLKPHLFDKFSKARRRGIKGEKSIGLGMSIIKNIVELHRGRIWCESVENQGTTFYVELPVG